ncbi:MAG: threonine synthase, partial [bacterium]
MRFSYRCTECDRPFEITPDLMVCPSCAGMQERDTPLRGLLEVEIDVDGRTAPSPPFPWPGELLPVEAAHFPAIPVGNTPLWEPDRLRHDLGLPRLYLKDDTLNPTGSLKDRASVLVAAFARKHGIARVTVASTGNAASSMAGIGAAAGLAVTIFVPENPPRAKLIQCLQYGAEVRRVDGPYDLAYRRSFDHVREHGGLNRNTGYNPLTIEGKKTAALEIFAQLGRMPDHVFVPVGDGVILCGIYKGFRDLVKLGFARTVPTVWAVQAEGSSAISRAVAAGGDFGQV